MSHRLPDLLIKERSVIGLVVSIVVALVCAVGATRACTLARDERFGRSPMTSEW